MICLLLSAEERERMAEENVSLVYYVVKMFSNSGIAYDELVSIGMVGYAKALSAFNKERNVKFSTYAINCIKNEILFFLRKERNHMKNNVSMNFVLSTDKNGNNLSLEETISVHEKDPSKRNKLLEEDVVIASDIACLMQALEYLTEKERYIITYRYGLDRGIVKTQREIADTINMSQANVSKIEKNILVKVRKILKDKFNIVDNHV